MKTKHNNTAYDWMHPDVADTLSKGIKPKTKEEKLKRFEGASSFLIVKDLLDYVDPELRVTYRDAIYDLAHTVGMCDSCEGKLCDIDWQNLQGILNVMVDTGTESDYPTEMEAKASY